MPGGSEEVPLSSFHGRLPVLETQLKSHLLHERRQEVGKVYDHLVHRVQGTAVVVLQLVIPRLPKQAVNIFTTTWFAAATHTLTYELFIYEPNINTNMTI